MTQLKHWIAAVMAIGVVGALSPVAGAADFGEAEHRGCCSHHSGVCGCEGGRAKCGKEPLQVAVFDRLPHHPGADVQRVNAGIRAGRFGEQR